MARRIAVEDSHAVALAAKMANVDVIAAYPITPQTHIVEELSRMVSDGEFDAEYINVESEHSAISACIGASAVGARCFTATAGQGLALMHEILFIAAGNRFPIVMAIANRCLSPNINIWGDQSDVMSSRDCGWIQIFAENAQEIFDLILSAFKISEDDRVLLPVAVNFDGFYATHVVERMDLPEEEEVRRFLPPHRTARYKLDPDRPLTFGAIGFPAIQFELRRQWEEALCNSKQVVKEVWQEFGRIFGRHYDVLEPYRMEDAEIGFILMGGSSGTCRVAVDRLRERGFKAGMIKLRLFRPFPKEEILEAVSRLKTLITVDKHICLGGLGGPLFNDLRSLFYGFQRRINVAGFIAGVGGRDIKVEDFEHMFEKVVKGEVSPEKHVFIVRGES
ncbi:MAG: 2-ketoisovalerate ferredoxin oxidoreductase subunit alpha [Candidatus Hecatellales archaeon B24]|nr:MAG: 2-ketoisovalerate ferredoxin oxidoreductase subunit alpha [Candidatus Hecatellales archaeon B24]